MVLMNRAIPADYLENEIGISRSVIEKVRDDESEFKNLTLDVAAKIQKWIDDGNYTFSYDYSELIEELEEDLAGGLIDDYLFIIRGDYNEALGKCPIIDYYYSQDEINDGDMAEKVLTEAVLNEMKQDNEIF
jgi:hypothetical protein